MYVEDILALHTDDESIEQFIERLSKSFTLAEKRDVNFLNINIGRTERRIELLQES